MKRNILWILAISLCACHAKIESESSDAETPYKEISAKVQNVPERADSNLKLIKTADYRMRVKNIDKSIAAIEHAVQKFPAHIASSNLTSNGGSIESVLTIRVESSYFIELLKEIDKEAAFVHYRNIKTEDVGKQFVDLEARLKTKREVQHRYEDILRKKAGTIEELLAAEKQIGELKEEIESAISKLNYLKDQVAFSTINIEAYEVRDDNQVAETEQTTWDKFGDAFLGGLNGSVEILLLLTRAWPILCVMTGILLVYKRRKKGLTV